MVVLVAGQNVEDGAAEELLALADLQADLLSNPQPRGSSPSLSRLPDNRQPFKSVAVGRGCVKLTNRDLSWCVSRALRFFRLCPSRAAAVGFSEENLAQSHPGRRDLDEFVGFDELQGFFEREASGRF